jgi:hypothetical protein
MMNIADEEEEVDEPLSAPKTMALLAGADEEEEDEPLPQPTGVAGSSPAPSSTAEAAAIAADRTVHTCSEEYTEALEGIASDQWDISSWIIFLEEEEAKSRQQSRTRSGRQS